jgi:hypothetical protein
MTISQADYDAAALRSSQHRATSKDVRVMRTYWAERWAAVLQPKGELTLDPAVSPTEGSTQPGATSQ